MKLNVIRLALGALWLILGLTLLLRDAIGLQKLTDRFPAENLNLCGGLAVAFAVWNTVRWYAGRPKAAAQPTPLVPKKTDERPFEYNPELDFTKPERDGT